MPWGLENTMQGMDVQMPGSPIPPMQWDPNTDAGTQALMTPGAPPTAQPVPPMSSPIGHALALLAANLGAHLLHRQAATDDINRQMLLDQKRQQDIIDQNHAERLAYDQETKKNRLLALIRISDQKFEVAKQNNDHLAQEAALKEQHRLAMELEKLRGANDLKAIGARNAGDVAVVRAKGAEDRKTLADKVDAKLESALGASGLPKEEQNRIRDNAAFVKSLLTRTDPATGEAVYSPTQAFDIANQFDAAQQKMIRDAQARYGIVPKNPTFDPTDPADLSRFFPSFPK